MSDEYGISLDELTARERQCMTVDAYLLLSPQDRERLRAQFPETHKRLSLQAQMLGELISGA